MAVTNALGQDQIQLFALALNEVLRYKEHLIIDGVNGRQAKFLITGNDIVLQDAVDALPQAVQGSRDLQAFVQNVAGKIQGLFHPSSVEFDTFGRFASGRLPAVDSLILPLAQVDVLVQETKTALATASRRKLEALCICDSEQLQAGEALLRRTVRHITETTAGMEPGSVNQHELCKSLLTVFGRGGKPMAPEIQALKGTMRAKCVADSGTLTGPGLLVLVRDEVKASHHWDPAFVPSPAGLAQYAGGELEPESKSQKHETRDCFYCKKSGHLKSQCPELKAKSKGHGKSPGAGKAKKKFTGTCNHCGKTGHKLNECRAKKAEDAEAARKGSSGAKKQEASQSSALLTMLETMLNTQAAQADGYVSIGSCEPVREAKVVDLDDAPAVNTAGGTATLGTATFCESESRRVGESEMAYLSRLMAELECAEPLDGEDSSVADDSEDETADLSVRDGLAPHPLEGLAWRLHARADRQRHVSRRFRVCTNGSDAHHAVAILVGEQVDGMESSGSSDDSMPLLVPFDSDEGSDDSSSEPGNASCHMTLGTREPEDSDSDNEPMLSTAACSMNAAEARPDVRDTDATKQINAFLIQNGDTIMPNDPSTDLHAISVTAVVDTGCTHLMSNSEKVCPSSGRYASPLRIRTAGQGALECQWAVTRQIGFKSGDKVVVWRPGEIHFVPKLTAKFLAGAKKLTQRAGDRLSLSRDGGVLQLSGIDVPVKSQSNAVPTIEIELGPVVDRGQAMQSRGISLGRQHEQKGSMAYWHAVLNHISDEAVKATIKDGANGKITTKSRPYCRTCPGAKGQRLGPLSNGSITTHMLGDVVQALPRSVVKQAIQDLKAKLEQQCDARQQEDSEVAECMEYMACDGFGPIFGKMYILWVDRKRSRKVWVFQCSTKAEYVATVDAMVKTSKVHQMRIKQIRHDAAGELTSSTWKMKLREYAIDDSPTPPRSQYVNGCAERHIGIIEARVKAMLHHAMLPLKQFTWAAIQDAVQKYNVTAQRGLNGQSPSAMFYNRKPDLTFARIFGSECYAIRPNDKLAGAISKIGYHAVQCVMLGVDEESNTAFKVQRLDNGRILRLRDVEVLDLTTPRTHPLKHHLASGEAQPVREANTLAGAGVHDSDDQLGDWSELDMVGTHHSPALADTENGSEVLPALPPAAPVLAPTGELHDEPHPAPQVLDTGLPTAIEPVVGVESNNDWSDKSRLRTNRGVPPERLGMANLGDGGASGDQGADALNAEMEDGTVLFVPEETFEWTASGMPANAAAAADDCDVIFREHDGGAVIIRSVDDDALAAMANGVTTFSYRQAILNNADPEERRLMELAARAEISENLLQGKVVEWVHPNDIPKNASPLRTAWVFKWKVDPATNKRIGAKGRCYVVGSQAKPFVHFDPSQRFSPTSTYDSALAQVALGTSEGVSAHSLDVKCAFPRGTPSHEVYLYTPQGHHRYDKQGRRYLWRELRNLYGSPEAARRWADLAVQALLDLGFVRGNWDIMFFRKVLSRAQAEEELAAAASGELGLAKGPIQRAEATAALVQESGNQVEDNPWDADFAAWIDEERAEAMTAADMGQMHVDHDEVPEVKEYDSAMVTSSMACIDDPGYTWVNLILWVDDAFLTSNHEAYNEHMVDRFLAKHPGTHGPNPTSFIGLAIQRNLDQSVTVHQSLLVQNIVTTAGMTSCRAASTPQVDYVQPAQEDVDPAETKQVVAEMNVARVNGQLNFLRKTRFDMLMPLSEVSRLTNRTRLVDLKAIKRVVRYINGTSTMGPTYHKQKDHGLVGFCDTNYGDEVHTSLIFYLFGGPWFARASRQRLVQLSAFGAEMVGLCEASKACIYLRELLREMGFRLEKPTPIYCDNKAVVDVVMNRDCWTSKVRHYRIRLAWVRQRIEEGDIMVHHVGTKDNVADLGTKPLPLPAFRDLRGQVLGHAPLRALVGVEEGARE